MRPGDRLALYELHREDALALSRAFAGDTAVEVHAADGWHALKTELPPRERRGLVLIDPAYEEPDEFGRAQQTGMSLDDFKAHLVAQGKFASFH